MGHGDEPGHGQSQAGPLVHFPQAKAVAVAVEHRVQQLRWDPAAVVADRQDHVAGGHGGAQDGAGRRPGMDDAVGQQIQDQLFEERVVRGEERRLLQLRPALEIRIKMLHQLQNGAAQGAQIKGAP